jgi:GTPase SAR1 family protein
MFYRGAKAAVICYDLTDDKTWDKVKFWAGEVARFEEDCKIYIVGNKLDLLVNTYLKIQTNLFVSYCWAVVVVLWSASLPTAPMIRVQILTTANSS